MIPLEPPSREEPVFAELWHARAFVLARTLIDLGYFTLQDWTAALGYELKCAADRGEADDGSHYYAHWLAALEKLTAGKGLTDAGELRNRKSAWEHAYRHTPHGKPVVLGERLDCDGARHSRGHGR